MSSAELGEYDDRGAMPKIHEFGRVDRDTNCHVRFQHDSTSKWDRSVLWPHKLEAQVTKHRLSWFPEIHTLPNNCRFYSARRIQWCSWVRHNLMVEVVMPLTKWEAITSARSQIEEAKELGCRVGEPSLTTSPTTQSCARNDQVDWRKNLEPTDSYTWGVSWLTSNGDCLAILIKPHFRQLQYASKRNCGKKEHTRRRECSRWD